MNLGHCRSSGVHVYKHFLFYPTSGRQLLYNYPHVYDSAYFSKNFPNMVAVHKNLHVRTAPWSSEEKLTSLARTTFHSFAKFSKFDAGKK